MRFTVRALGALAVSGMLAVTHPGVADAAVQHRPEVPGNVYVGRKKIENPLLNNCYYYGGGPIKNATTGTLIIYSDRKCNGIPLVTLMRGAYVFRASGRGFIIM